MSYLIAFLVISTVLLIWSLFRLTIVEEKVKKIEEKLLHYSDVVEFYDTCLDNIHQDIKIIKEDIKREMP